MDVDRADPARKVACRKRAQRGCARQPRAVLFRLGPHPSVQLLCGLSLRIGSQLSDDERDPLSQRTPGEVDVAVDPIELRDDWTCQPADHLESRGKLRPALKRVSALASLDFGESIYDVAALGSGKPDEGSTLNQVPTPRDAPLVAGSGVAI